MQQLPQAGQRVSEAGPGQEPRQSAHSWAASAGWSMTSEQPSTRALATALRARSRMRLTVGRETPMRSAASACSRPS